MCIRKHTPTPDEIRIAVAKPFRTTVEAILSKSRKTNCVVPREVTAYLMQVRGLMTVDVIALEVGNDWRWVNRMIANTRDRMRVDADFAAMVWEAEKIILGITA